jgi:formate hydrogenlyase subunit 6/NADH:ubiquinone oxidoreductase subunit I
MQRSIWKATVDKERCVGCGLCTRICPQKAIKLIPISELEKGTNQERLQKLKGKIGMMEKELDRLKEIGKIKI